MKFARGAVLFSLSVLLAAPIAAQTTIGGGSCSSATANGTYAVSITGRQVASSGTFTNVFQSNGSAVFDGLSKVTISLTHDTASVSGSPLTLSGNYSVQANCVGLINITTGGPVTFNMVLYANGANFQLTGYDTTYSYTGSGNVQPASCAASMLAGVYALSGTGYSLAAGSVNGAGAVAGLMQFDGHSSVTANLTISGTGPTTTGTLTGSYSISSNCLGSATFTDSKGAPYVMSITVDSATKLYSSNFYLGLAQTGKFLVSASAHAVYGQPASTPATEAAADLAKGEWQ